MAPALGAEGAPGEVVRAVHVEPRSTPHRKRAPLRRGECAHGMMLLGAPSRWVMPAVMRRARARARRAQ